MHQLWKWLEHLDQALFLKINQGASNPVFDAVLPWLRESSFWVPLYLFMAIFILYNFGWRGLIWGLALGLTIALADNLSSKWIKYAFMRLRPCQDPDFFQYIKLRVGYCPGNPSFTSSHAANHFAVAGFVYFAGKKYFTKHMAWFFLWAGIISFAQVYVGVHYPIDILGGTLVGTALGWIVANVYNRRFSLLNPQKVPDQTM
jgi:undecaprenyl-diphosphatase